MFHVGHVGFFLAGQDTGSVYGDDHVMEIRKP